MRRKKLKLQNQDEQLRKEIQDEPPIFKGMVIHVLPSLWLLLTADQWLYKTAPRRPPSFDCEAWRHLQAGTFNIL